MTYSIYGATGFIGNSFCKLFPNHIASQGREERKPITNDIIYFISTTDNYNIHNNITLDVETNLKVLCEVLDYCRSEDITFNFISSWFVYGKTELPAKEEYCCNPSGFYSITKKAAEDLIISFCLTYNVKYRILRLCNALGRNDINASSKKNAITYMIELLKKNEDVFIYEGEPIRDVMHVDDICEAIKLVCENGHLNEIYNIGTGQPTKISDIIERSKKYLNSKSNILTKAVPEFHKLVQTADFWMDVSKLKSLGFSPKISTDSIIGELCH